jgi:hypothetical protein
MIPLLHTFITDDDVEEYKKRISAQIEFFKNVIDRLKDQFKNVKNKHFTSEEKYLFLRNLETVLKRDNFNKTKSGLTFLRYLLYYIQKLETKVNEIYIKDFCLSKAEIVKYAYKNSHVRYVSQVIHYYLFPSKDNIFDLPPQCERWQRILENTEIKVVYALTLADNVI